MNEGSITRFSAPKGWKLIKAKQKFKNVKGNYSFRIDKVG